MLDDEMSTQYMYDMFQRDPKGTSVRHLRQISRTPFCQEREVQQLRERVITQGEELTRLQTLLVQSSDTSETSESESSESLESSEFLILHYQIYQIPSFSILLDY